MPHWLSRDGKIESEFPECYERGMVLLPCLGSPVFYYELSQRERVSTLSLSLSERGTYLTSKVAQHIFGYVFKENGLVFKFCVTLVPRMVLFSRARWLVITTKDST
eukprot:scaffold23385_cov95-Skeletonema_menzelii.AAC.1